MIYGSAYYIILIKYYYNTIITQCHVDIPLRTFEIVVGSVGSVAVLLFVTLTVIIMVAILKKWCCPWLGRRRHGGRQRVEQDEN